MLLLPDPSSVSVNLFSEQVYDQRLLGQLLPPRSILRSSGATMATPMM